MATTNDEAKRLALDDEYLSKRIALVKEKP